MAKVRGGEAWQKKLDELAAKVAKGAKLDVGFLPDKTYAGSGTLVAMVAAIQEYGAPSRKIPPRPFFRQMIVENSPDWPKQVAIVLKNHDYDGALALDDMGKIISGDLRQKINTFAGVPLSPATIARKGFDKQLIDESTMVDSIDYVVEE